MHLWVRERFQSFEGKEKEKKERTSGEEMRDEVEEVVEVLDEDSAMNDDDTQLSSERFLEVVKDGRTAVLLWMLKMGVECGWKKDLKSFNKIHSTTYM